MEVLRSNKGGDKLCHDGHMYVLHKSCNNHKRWRCAKYSSLTCRAILLTTLDQRNLIIQNLHNYITDREGINVVRTCQLMKARARNDGTDFQMQIFAKSVTFFLGFFS